MSATPAPPTPTKPTKAIVAFVLTVAGLVAQALAGDADGVITAVEWVIILLGSLGTAGAVYQVTNAPKYPRSRRVH